MMRENQFRKLVLLGGVLCVLACSSRFAAAESYVWPLDGPKNISSGFCSYRDAHYHGGLDLSTDGREGLPVHAADSGYVYRLTTSYWGYGKAVYVRLVDGRLAVYGHLSDFNDPIRRYVEHQQYALKRYKTNQFPSVDELPVGRGEVIGYTGQSGYGPPHLHFEIRTGENYPINPLAMDVGYDDRIVPEFDGLLVRPLLTVDPESRVEEKLLPVFVKAERNDRTNRYQTDKIISVTGAVGLAVECYDPTKYKGYSMPPARLEVKVNGLRFFEKSYDSLDFDLTRQLDLDYDFDWLAEGGTRVTTLYRHPANTLPWYNTALGDGILDPRRPGSPLTPGENRLEITAADPAGNEAVLECTILVNRPPQAEGMRLHGSAGQWYLIGRVHEPDDFVARLAIQRKQSNIAGWETVWDKADSVTQQNVEYIVPGPFTSRDELQLVLIDHWGAESAIPLAPEDRSTAEFESREREAVELVGDFVPGGLALRGRKGNVSFNQDEIVMLARMNGPLPASWNSFIDAREFYRATRDGLWEKVMLSEDGAHVERALRPEETMPDREILLWPRDIHVVDASQTTAVYSPDSLARARFNAGDAYDGGFYRIRPYALPGTVPAAPASRAYSYEPISVPFAQKVEVGISYTGLDASVDDLALYALHVDQKSWLYLGRDVDPATGFMSARVWSFGPYALLADTKPPKISEVIPGRGATTRKRRPDITFRLVDELSGIGSDQDIEIVLDGDWLIPEYDPETERGRTRPPRDLAPGKHKLEITARDRVGHEDYFLRYFTVIK